MINAGMYWVEFSSNVGNLGTGGLVFVENGRLHGGDRNFLYRGSYREQGGQVDANVHVSNYTGQSVSVFGPLNDFHLKLTGSAAGQSFKFSGTVAGRADLGITITGRKVADPVG